jgi:hypothetical protein
MNNEISLLGNKNPSGSLSHPGLYTSDLGMLNW